MWKHYKFTEVHTDGKLTDVNWPIGIHGCQEGIDHQRHREFVIRRWGHWGTWGQKGPQYNGFLFPKLCCQWGSWGWCSMPLLDQEKVADWWAHFSLPCRAMITTVERSSRHHQYWRSPAWDAQALMPRYPGYRKETQPEGAPIRLGRLTYLLEEFLSLEYLISISLSKYPFLNHRICVFQGHHCPWLLDCLLFIHIRHPCKLLEPNVGS